MLQVRLSTVAGAVPEPRNPKVVDPPAAIVPFQLTFLTVTSDPLLVAVPLHNCARVCAPGQVQDTVHLPMAASVACTITCPWKPPVQALTTLYIAEQPPETGGVVGVVGVVVEIGRAHV